MGFGFLAALACWAPRGTPTGSGGLSGDPLEVYPWDVDISRYEVLLEFLASMGSGSQISSFTI